MFWKGWQMEKYTAFEKFAPLILEVYQRDKEAFWAAIMAPFLDKQASLGDMWAHLKVDMQLLSAFKGLDEDAKRLLQMFSAPLGCDLTRWKSNRTQYFKDAYPVFAFLVVWMHEEDLDDLLSHFAEILQAGVFAVAGYGILDENVDANQPSPVEILTAQALIAEYELRALSIFGVSPVNLAILHKMRTLFLTAEIKEKSMRGKSSPYHLDHPEDLGAKGANAVSPFMLCLERLGRADQIDDYWRVFLLFGAAIQMMDDWQDLEADLAIGHYSYVTLGHETWLSDRDHRKTAQRIKADMAHVRATYARATEMIAEARAILSRLQDRFLFRLVDVTELRLNQAYRKEFKRAFPG